MRLFWEKQQKYLQSFSTNVKYYPMMMRYVCCLHQNLQLHLMIYSIMKNSGARFVILHSHQRFGDYKNYIQPQQCFKKDIMNELLEKLRYFCNNESFLLC